MTENGVTSQTIQESSSILIGEGYDLGNPLTSVPGFKETTNFRPKYASEEKKKSKRTIAKFFSSNSNLSFSKVSFYN